MPLNLYRLVKHLPAGNPPNIAAEKNKKVSLDLSNILLLIN